MGKFIATVVAILIYILLNIYHYKHVIKENKQVINVADAYVLGLAVGALIRTLIKNGII